MTILEATVFTEQAHQILDNLEALFYRANALIRDLRVKPSLGDALIVELAHRFQDFDDELKPITSAYIDWVYKLTHPQ